MGSSTWKVVVVVVLLVAVVVGLELATYRNPAILALATRMASDSHLPLWLVGLAAPLAYAWKRLVGGSSGAGAKLDALERDNERLKAEQARLRQEVSELNGWREREVARQRLEIARLQGDLDALNGRIATNDRKLADAAAAPPSAYAEGMTPGQVEDAAGAYLRENHIEVAE